MPFLLDLEQIWYLLTWLLPAMKKIIAVELMHVYMHVLECA